MTDVEHWGVLTIGTRAGERALYESLARGLTAKAAATLARRELA